MELEAFDLDTQTDSRTSKVRQHYIAMKIRPFLVVIVCLSVLAGYSASAQDTNKILGTMNFVNVPVDRVLDTYKALSKSKLVVASDVRQATRSITMHATAVPPEVVRHMIEQALLKQAGIVMTRLDDKQVSVTYNDQLKLEP